jgi:hypothetical protein
VSFVVRVFMWVSRCKRYLIVPYPKNTAGSCELQQLKNTVN